MTFLTVNRILEERNKQRSLNYTFFFDDIKCIHCHTWFGHFYDLINCYIFTNTLQFRVAKSPQNRLIFFLWVKGLTNYINCI